MKRLILAFTLLFLSAPAFAQAPVFCPTRPASDASNACASTQFVGTAILGLPGGTNGQVQYNNASVFGGFTVGGDATLSTASGVLTLATVNSNVGTFGSATSCVTTTVNGKGLTTAISAATCTPAVGSITGLGTGIATALGVNTGSAGAPVLFNGAGGTPSSITLTNGTGLPLSGLTGFGTGVATALGVNVGTAGAFVTNGGALGTPSSGTGTNLTGIPTTGLTGTLQAAQEPAHTGGVTNSAGSLALTVITNANLTGDVTSSGNATTFTGKVSGALGQIPGTTTNDNANASAVGEYYTTGTGNNNASATVTITIAAPAVVTWTGHGFCFSGAGGACGTTTSAATAIQFTTTGTLPTGITATTTYYLKAIDANTFNIATTCANALAGTFITTTGSQSGTQTGDIRVVAASTTSQDVACLSLPAGDWEVSGQTLAAAATTSTVVTDISGNLATSSAGTDRTWGRRLSIEYSNNTLAIGNSEFTVFNLGPARFPLSGATTIFNVQNFSFSAAGMTSSGWLRARRAR